MPDDAGQGEFLCIRCGYDLLGLPPEASSRWQGRHAACPECGLLVRASRLGGLEQQLGPREIRAIRRGAILHLLGFVSLFLLSPVLLGGALGGTGSGLRVLFGLLCLGVALAATLLGHVGWWKIATPTLRGSPPSWLAWSVRVATIGLVVYAMPASVGALLELAGLSRAGRVVFSAYEAIGLRDERLVLGYAALSVLRLLVGLSWARALGTHLSGTYVRDSSSVALGLIAASGLMILGIAAVPTQQGMWCFVGLLAAGALASVFVTSVNIADSIGTYLRVREQEALAEGAERSPDVGVTPEDQLKE
jgi:hypothetical protein